MKPRQIRNWVLTEAIGKGGQGTAFKGFDTKDFDLYGQVIPGLESSINFLGKSNSGSRLPENYVPFAEKFVVQINKIIESNTFEKHIVLKEFHDLVDSINPDAVAQRFQQEVDVLKRMSHPNLLKVIDYDLDKRWYVCKYYKNKTLIENKPRFKGNLLESLSSFRGIVSGVAELHKGGIVHRDIKPHNVFVDESGNLVLGDFGLVFFMDPGKTRVTNTMENVGSWNWMPEWATNERLEDTKPSFDVFSLGKLLWSMLTGEEYLRLWYYEDDRFNVVKKFPNDPTMSHANEIFKQCIVEREANCLPNAEALLVVVDSILGALKNQNVVLIGKWDKRCRFCGNGTYQTISDEVNNQISRLGLNNYGNNHYKVFNCNNCGHLETFFYSYENKPPIWGKIS
jgi:serine/threonine protein kinase